MLWKLYTHTIYLACVGKKEAKEHKNDHGLWYNLLDKCFQSMHNGQSNGVPQGSVLSDFIAELVLGCCDEIVSNEIEEQIINVFYIET